jgi:hypothetical protein
MLDHNIEYAPTGPNSNSYAYGLMNHFVSKLPKDAVAQFPVPPKKVKVTGCDKPLPFDPPKKAP